MMFHKEANDRKSRNAPHLYIQQNLSWISYSTFIFILVSWHARFSPYLKFVWIKLQMIANGTQRVLSKKNEFRLGESRSSRLEVFCRKVVLRNFAKFTGKHLRQSLFSSKALHPSIFYHI